MITAKDQIHIASIHRLDVPPRYHLAIKNELEDPTMYFLITMIVALFLAIRALVEQGFGAAVGVFFLVIVIAEVSRMAVNGSLSRSYNRGRKMGGQLSSGLKNGPKTGLTFDMEDAVEIMQKANHLRALGALSDATVDRIYNDLGTSEITRARKLGDDEMIPPIRNLDPHYSTSAIATVSNSRLLKAGESDLAQHIVMSRLEGKEPTAFVSEPVSTSSVATTSSIDEIEYHGASIRKENGRWFIGEEKFSTLGKAKAHVKKNASDYSN